MINDPSQLKLQPAMENVLLENLLLLVFIDSVRDYSALYVNLKKSIE